MISIAHRRSRILLVLAMAITAPAASAAQVPRSITDSAFAALIARFSEPSGYFDTDNLISNEDSYLHPMTTLRRIGVSGGVYIGVGPDQNYSYIAAVRPRAAVIIDIRRDNLLQHLLLKSVFAISRNRAEYLCNLFGKQAPADTASWSGRSIDSLLAFVHNAPSSTRAVTRVRAAVVAELQRAGLSSSGADLATTLRFHSAFVSEGPHLRFTTHGRSPSAEYPDFGQLAAAVDLEGRQRSYLASETAFQFVKGLHARNLVIPVVGNFGGSKAFSQVALWMRGHNDKLSALYTSNVEQYLFRDGLFPAFASNVANLPRDARSVVIRSCFSACRGVHSHRVGRFNSVQMVQLADTFAALTRSRRVVGYFDLVSVGLVPP